MAACHRWYFGQEAAGGTGKKSGSAVVLLLEEIHISAASDLR